MEDILLLLGMLIVFAAVLFIAWLTARLLGKKMAGTSKNRLLNIVETLPLGVDRYLYLVKVGKRYFLFFASRKNMEFVSEIEVDGEALASGAESTENSGFNFKRIFDMYSGLSGKGKPAENAGEDDTGGKNAEIHREGLSDSIRKLRKLNGNGE